MRQMDQYDDGTDRQERRRLLIDEMQGPDPQAAPEGPPPSATPEPSAAPSNNGGALPPSPAPQDTESFRGGGWRNDQSIPTPYEQGGITGMPDVTIQPVPPQQPPDRVINYPEAPPPQNPQVMGEVSVGVATPTAAFLKQLLESGLSVQQAIQHFNQRTGRTTGNEAVYFPGNNTIGLPEAYLAGGPGGWQIVQRGPEGPSAAPAAAPAAPAAAPAMPGAAPRAPMSLGGYSFNPATGYQFGYTGGQSGLPPEIAQFYKAQTEAITRQQEQQQQIQATMRDALLRMMASGQEPVDVANDQTLGPAAAAYRNAQHREQKQGREALAERAAFLGLNPGGQGSGAFESALASQDESTRNAIAGYEGQLAQTELQNRRGLLVQALQIASALGARTEANDLQRELAQLDAALRQQQLQYNYATLGQQQGQYEDTLGYNYAALLANANRNNFLSLME